MKSTLISLLLFSAVLCYGQRNNPLDPPDMVRIDDNFWVSQSEVLTQHWIDYFYIVTRDSGDHHANRIRPILLNNWVIPSSRENLRRERVYNNQPTSLRNLRMSPITYISYQQALDYCDWRSKMMNSYLREIGISKTIRFRLPTKKEWDRILAYNRRWEETKLRRANRYVNKIDSDRRQVAVFQIPSTVRDRRIYQLYHNVSEMTAERGIAIGMNNGNFSLGQALNPTFNYRSPGPLLGFRMVAEYID